MRLSDVKGERVFDVIADIMEPVIDIAMSDDARELMRPEPCPEGMDPRKFMADRIRTCAPRLIRSQKGNIVKVLAAIGGVSEDEYMADMTLMKLVSDVSELIGDETFTDFFSSLGVTQDQTEGEL